MKIDWNSKYTAISVYSVLTFTVCLLIFVIAAKFGAVLGGVKDFLSVISPVLYGAVIAYLLDPIMIRLDNFFRKKFEKKKPRLRLSRILSVVLTIIIFLAILAALGFVIIPQISISIGRIGDNMEVYLNSFENWLNGIFKNNRQLTAIIDDHIESVGTYIENFINEAAPKIGDILIKIMGGAVSVVVALKDFLIGIIIAVYFLLDKEHFLAQAKKIVYAILPQKAVKGFFKICTMTNRSVGGFISGKIIDSIIIGILCFICMTVMKFDYSLLISVIVGVTNVIPIFGPIIGAIPGALLLLISAPKQFIPFLILILIIQQLDGKVIGPRILGEATGLPSFWVLFAILVGGGLLGVAGMIMGVPIFAVIYSLTKELINYLLKRKNMSENTMDYAFGAANTTEKTVCKDKNNSVK